MTDAVGDSDRADTEPAGAGPLGGQRAAQELARLRREIEMAQRPHFIPRLNDLVHYVEHPDLPCLSAVVVEAATGRTSATLFVLNPAHGPHFQRAADNNAQRGAGTWHREDQCR